MAVTLTSPFPFAERILLFGGGGVGKTHAVLQVARHTDKGRFLIVDRDYSAAYERAIYTEFAEVRDRCTLVEPNPDAPDWEDFLRCINEAVAASTDPLNDWLIIDPISPSWDWVQQWTLEQTHGVDLPRYLMELKREWGDDSRGYSAALANSMNWDLVKKEYAKVYRFIQKWKGNLIIVAEAKSIGQDKDEEVQMLFGPLGFKPAGEQRLKHVASTTLFLDHPKRGQWRMTTIKDRNRDEMDKATVDNFALDYLEGIAGWEVVRQGRPAPAPPQRTGKGKSAPASAPVVEAEDESDE